MTFKTLSFRARPLLPAAVLFVTIVLPFVLWNPGAFFDDVIRYQAGTLPSTNYPIKTLGLGALALAFGWVRSNTDPFPPVALQLVTVGPAFVLLMWRQWRHNTSNRLLVNSALLFLFYGFFSRVFNDNHLGFGLTWLILPSFIADIPNDSAVPESGEAVQTCRTFELSSEN